MWDGVRNYQARNYLKTMKLGERVLFYHSVTAPIGIVGEMEVIKTAYPDPTQFDPKSEYFDPKSSQEAPRWMCPNFGFIQKFSRVISLEELKKQKPLHSMALLQKGSRLSVHLVNPDEYQYIIGLAKK